jgi:hypothetical protein
VPSEGPLAAAKAAKGFKKWTQRLIVQGGDSKQSRTIIQVLGEKIVVTLNFLSEEEAQTFAWNGCLNSGVVWPRTARGSVGGTNGCF